MGGTTLGGHEDVPALLVPELDATMNPVSLRALARWKAIVPKLVKHRNRVNIIKHEGLGYLQHIPVNPEIQIEVGTTTQFPRALQVGGGYVRESSAGRSEDRLRSCGRAMSRT